jgi:membrane protein required for colicin V production
MFKSADYWVIAIVLASAIAGLMRGFLREVLAVVSWVLGLFIAWHFAYMLAPQLGGLLSDEPVRSWAARGILLFLVLAIGAVVGLSVSHFVRLSIFIGTDRLLGFALGIVRGIIIVGVLVMVGQLLRLDGERWWRTALLAPYAEHVANGLRSFVGAEHYPVTRV